MTKTVFAIAAAIAAASTCAYAGPIHTQTSVEEIVVYAHDKEPLTPRYEQNVVRSLAIMDIRLRTDIAKATYARNEAALGLSLSAPTAAALAFVGS